jgi:hypothetical protein
MAMKGLINVIVCIDDILLPSRNHSELRQQLKKLFVILRNAGLKANLSKCEFRTTNVSYLGYRLTPDGILPRSDKLRAIRASKPPSTVQEMRQFTGLFNYFHS